MMKHIDNQISSCCKIGQVQHRVIIYINVVVCKCCNLYSFVVYLYVSGSGSITSVGEERSILSAVVYL